MYIIFFILVFIGITCNGDSTGNDWRSQGFYRPRRNNLGQNQAQNYNQNTKPFGYQNVQRQNFGSSYNQNQNAQNAFNTQNVKNAFGFNSFQTQTVKTGLNTNSQTYQKPQNQHFGSNSQIQNVFGSSFRQNTLKNPFEYQVDSRNSFGASFGQNQGQSFTSNFGWKTFPSNFKQTVYKAPDYLPPRETTRAPYRASTYLPPKETPKPRKYHNGTALIPENRIPNRFYKIPTLRPITTPRPAVLPAMAMRVPEEPEDDPTTPMPPEPEDDPTTTPSTTTTSTTPSTTTSSTTPSTTTSSTTPSTTTTSTTPSTTTSSTTPSTTTSSTTPSTTTTSTTPSTTTSSTTPSTTTTSTTPSTTTTSTTPSTTTTSTTPSTTTTSTTPSTTTPDLNRFLEDIISTTAATEIITTTQEPFKASMYLPPKENKVPIPTPAIAVLVPPQPDEDPTPLPTPVRFLEDDPTTPRRPNPRPPPAPAMAIPVPPEPEDEPTSPSTTTTTTTKPSTTTTSITPYDSITPRDRFLVEEVTTPPPFRGYQYLPPEFPLCVPDLKKRLRRSTKTLELGEVTGARPVWHVGIYKKTTIPYMQICGGSVVRQDVVISAAHCFWIDLGPDSPENYAVGANKVYKPYGEAMDKRAQKSDVKHIILPPRYRGSLTSFQDDLAILKLVTPFTYARGLRPVCIDFDDDFDEQQLANGNKGTVAGWGYTDSEGSKTQYLLWLELPYVDIETCIQRNEGFVRYITSDKVCAGEFNTGRALCKGDSGGGLVFWHGEPANAVPYLRGIASTAPSADNLKCNVLAAGSFTRINAHRRFLRKQLPGIDQDCKYNAWNK